MVTEKIKYSDGYLVNSSNDISLYNNAALEANVYDRSEVDNKIELINKKINFIKWKRRSKKIIKYRKR